MYARRVSFHPIQTWHPLICRNVGKRQVFIGECSKSPALRGFSCKVRDVKDAARCVRVVWCAAAYPPLHLTSTVIPSIVVFGISASRGRTPKRRHALKLRNNMKRNPPLPQGGMCRHPKTPRLHPYHFRRSRLLEKRENCKMLTR